MNGYHDGVCWNWIQYACDSCSGLASHFDWKGEEQEEPWEIAEQALASTAPPEQGPEKSCETCSGSGVVNWTAAGTTTIEPCPKCQETAKEKP